MPAATAAPNTPVRPGLWNPFSSLECRVARPMRVATSIAATKAVSRSRPPVFTSSATASADGTSPPGCTPALGFRRQSISKACVSAPLASAAIGALTFVPATLKMLHGPPAPLCKA